MLVFGLGDLETESHVLAQVGLVLFNSPLASASPKLCVRYASGSILPALFPWRRFEFYLATFNGQVILGERGQPGHPWLVWIHTGVDEERGDPVEDEGVCPGG